jgi:hypothetical protein
MALDNQKNILAVGCSITRGHGLAQEHRDDQLWVNQICKSIGQVTNLSKTGANNHWIFLETASAVIQEQFDIVIVGWSGIPRFNFHVGLELYTVETRLQDLDITVNNNVTFKGSWLEKLGNDLRKLHNDHWDILDLVKYVNVLIKLHETRPHKKIFFVNTLGPWSSDYFVRKAVSRPSELPAYENFLLETENRDDNEILALYDMIHDQYQQYGNIQSDHWLNLYDPLKSLQVDQVSDLDPHPGYLSQSRFTEYLAPILHKKLLEN